MIPGGGSGSHTVKPTAAYSTLPPGTSISASPDGKIK
jgi:hypothetical protein